MVANENFCRSVFLRSGQSRGVNQNRLSCTQKNVHWTPVNLIESSRYKTRGLCYKYITIINDDSRVITMMLKVVVSPMIIILEKIYCTCITYNRQNIFIVKAVVACPINLFAAVIFVVL